MLLAAMRNFQDAMEVIKLSSTTTGGALQAL
jgi:hypothetical protein